MSFLAGPIILVLYLGYKVYSRDWKLYVKAIDMDLQTGIVLLDEPEHEIPWTWKTAPRRLLSAII